MPKKTGTECDAGKRDIMSKQAEDGLSLRGGWVIHAEDWSTTWKSMMDNQ